MVRYCLSSLFSYSNFNYILVYNSNYITFKKHRFCERVTSKIVFLRLYKEEPSKKITKSGSHSSGMSSVMGISSSRNLDLASWICTRKTASWYLVKRSRLSFNNGQEETVSHISFLLVTLYDTKKGHLSPQVKRQFQKYGRIRWIFLSWIKFRWDFWQVRCLYHRLRL